VRSFKWCKGLPESAGQARTASTSSLSKSARLTVRLPFLAARRETLWPRWRRAREWPPQPPSREPVAASDQVQESQLDIRPAIDFRPSRTPAEASRLHFSKLWTELTNGCARPIAEVIRITCGGQCVVASEQLQTCWSATTQGSRKAEGQETHCSGASSAGSARRRCDGGCFGFPTLHRNLADKGKLLFVYMLTDKPFTGHDCFHRTQEIAFNIDFQNVTFRAQT
jgi:hypothetical protein